MDIFSFVMVGSNDYKKLSEFYDAIFVPLGIKKIVTTDRYIGYGNLKESNEIKFYITKPVNGEPATFGNGTQVTFLAKTKNAVDEFYKIALSKGAIDEGSPGARSDGNYYAYVRDFDGNKIAAQYIIN
tara:strand:- start:241 stop:624 length:384 start_codon:yes stop_codon:yes gene_type:complete